MKVPPPVDKGSSRTQVGPSSRVAWSPEASGKRQTVLAEELALGPKYITWSRAESLGAFPGAYMGWETQLADHNCSADALYCLNLTYYACKTLKQKPNQTVPFYVES